jgi:chromosome segregation ATPase|eukprot:COSAG05_NODE_526_length_8925_cov_1.898142_3_plen_221_part_00
MAAGAIIGGAVSIVGGIIGASRARREARRREAQASALESKLNNLEANRQEIIDPYANITDLSSMLSNPFANLSVATKATEMQMEQTDIALANTLDTIRATGGSAGGATALAQAALQSKKGIAANIEQQEAANEKQRAMGEATLQQQRMSEAQRQQQADVAGDQFVFQQTEAREMQQLNRLSNQIGALRGQAATANADATAAITGAIGGAASMLGTLGGKK